MLANEKFVVTLSFTRSSKFYPWNWTINNIDKNSTRCMPWTDGIACCSLWSLHVLDLKNAFLLSRISSNTFCWLILQKIKRWKNFNFLLKPFTISPLEKSWFFDFFNFLILESKKAFFSFLEYLQTRFPVWFWQK